MAYLVKIYNSYKFLFESPMMKFMNFGPVDKDDVWVEVLDIFDLMDED